MSDEEGGLNGSAQHLFEVYSQESESLRLSSGVDLSAALLCPDPTGYCRTGLFSSGSIAVIAHWCFRSSRAAKGFACETLACVRAQPSRSHCGDGLLHRANDHLRCALLLLCHRPRPSAHSAFQRHAAPDEPVGCPAAKRSLPV